MSFQFQVSKVNFDITLGLFRVFRFPQARFLEFFSTVQKSLLQHFYLTKPTIKELEKPIEMTFPMVEGNVILPNIGFFFL